jgi:plastocyanin
LNRRWRLSIPKVCSTMPSFARVLPCAAMTLLLCAMAQAAPQVFTVVNGVNQPVAQAVVAVMVKGARTTANPGTVADMGQRGRSFVPTVVAIQTGSSVNFPNFDTVRHHVYSFSPIKPFEIKLYAGTPTAPVMFDKPGTATLGCNIHDKMIGYIHVVDTPYFGLTDAAGKVTIEVPAGEHKVRTWHSGMSEATAPIESNLKTGAPVTLKVPG